ncbi:MAG: universal stress protein [Syntrophaceae bacterium]|jgi:nucleotide-binding universal stress UspA family protein
MKILCAIDGSRQSQWGLNWLSRLCSPQDDALLLVHAVDMTRYKNLPRMHQNARSSLVKVLEFSLEGAAQLLEQAELKAAGSWGQVRARLLRGSPAEVIARLAKREKVDLLVVGSRGVTEFQPMLLGSVSRKLLAQAPCPVLVVKKPAKALTRVVLGADGSMESWEAVALVQAWPSEVRPQVTVASIVPPLPLESLRVPARAIAVGDQVEGTLRREAQKLAARVAGTLRKAGFIAKGIVLSGSPGAELVKLARCERAELIVVGSRSGRSPHEYFLGSVADTVAKHAPCSVLVHRQ